MSYPSTASLTGTVTWSDSTPFNGWALFILAYPTGYTSAAVSNQLVSQAVAGRLKVRIENGAYDSAARLYYTSNLTPPGCLYCAYYYDDQNNKVNSNTPPLFAVTSGPVTPPAPTIPVTSPPTTPPNP